MSIESEIKEHIISNFARDVTYDQLDSNFNLLDNGVVDSLGLLRLIAWVGDKYEIIVDEEQISPENFRSVAAIQQFVEEVGSADRGDGKGRQLEV